jgi:hypothetical protein
MRAQGLDSTPKNLESEGDVVMRDEYSSDKYPDFDDAGAPSDHGESKINLPATDLLVEAPENPSPAPTFNPVLPFDTSKTHTSVSPPGVLRPHARSLIPKLPGPIHHELYRILQQATESTEFVRLDTAFDN